ncbi:MAG TPA: amidase [Gemmatimonadales bacterium]|nr:amidase [Gemmatimonadales bacterium]
MNRRDFVRAGAAAGGSLAALSRRTARRAPPRPDDFELAELTIAELQQGMQARRYTARALCEQYLSRIEAINLRGPAIHAVIDTNPDALQIADALDRERKKRMRGPLHGIPVLVKDNIATTDRMATTAGSLALAGAKYPRDAFVVERLRAAGAVLLGKTNMSEWANFRSTHSSSGWSARGGQGRNPYALDRSPCGSSSGSGSAVAASCCAVAVGTETDGSIVCPSAAHSLVGLKPTLGLVSRAGIIPIAHSQDTAGPMARTVRDAAILLGALAGADPRDPATGTAPKDRPTDYTRFLDPNGFQGAKIGVARTKFFGYHAQTDRLAEDAIEAMRRLGAVIVDPADVAHAGEYDDSELEVLLYEFKSDLNRFLADLGPDAPVHTLAEVIAFNEQHAAQELAYFDQDLFLRAQDKGPLTDDAYRAALAKDAQLARDEGLDATFAKFTLDAIVAPSGNPPWPIDLINGDHFLGSSTTPAAVAGYPSVTVPVGDAFGLPVGLSFIGKPYTEPLLIKFAYALEQATKARRPPRFLATADLTGS